MTFNELTDKMRAVIKDIEVYIPEYSENSNPEIEILISDSRKVTAKTIFACVAGEHSDGHDYAGKAIKNGAVALLCERKMEIPVPQIIYPNVRGHMGTVASLLYGNPSEKLIMIGITGTNGKTTSTFMLKSILESAGIKTGLLGTVFYDDGNIAEDADRTTPEGSELQLWLRRMVYNGCKACVMEVSSHSLDQGRVRGIRYNSGGFTNLTVDHLDYHKTMENYFDAKKQIFNHMKKEWSFSVNSDDSYGKRIKDEYGDSITTYSITDKNADCYAEIKAETINGTEINVKLPGMNKNKRVILPVIGDYNVMNALQAASIASNLGVKADIIVEGLEQIKQVPGRLEKYNIKDSGTYIIDFAHTPDALKKTIELLRKFTTNRLIVIFGAGGDRDNSKRPLMGNIATSCADVTIITSDNPRSENPEKIINDIKKGIGIGAKPYITIVNREEAVKHGLNMMKSGDIVLVAGKGAEQVQIVKDQNIPYRDIDVLKKWCAEKTQEVF